MMTLRCTRKLLEYFDEEPALALTGGESAPSLGDWYANLVFFGPNPIALCVNAETRYAIVIRLDDCDELLLLYIRLARRIDDAMRRLGIPNDVCARVLDEHRGGVNILETKDRSVLGTINDLAKHLIWNMERRLQDGPIRDPADLDDDLNVIPHRPIGWSKARDRLVQFFGAAPR